MHDKLARNLQKLSPQQMRDIKVSLERLIEVLEIQDLDASPLLTAEEPVQPAD